MAPVTRRDEALAGAARALRLAALFAPLLVPFALLKAALVTAPWLDSLEARQQVQLVVLEGDGRIRAVLEALVRSGSGLTGFAALTLLASGLWLLVVRKLGRVRVRPALARRGGLVAAAVLAGAWACGASLVAVAGGESGRLLDIATSVRPIGPQSVLLLVANEAFGLLVAGAAAGAALAALESVRHARHAAALLLVLVFGAALAAQSAFAQGVVRRYDMDRSFADALGARKEAGVDTVLATARGVSWRVAISRSVSGVPLDEELARRAEAVLEARRGLTSIAGDAERYVVAERLVAFDPQGAREAGLRAVLRRGSQDAAYGLLSSLGSCAPSAETRALVSELESSPGLRLGPTALRLLANARAHAGDRAGAETCLARLRSFDGDRGLVEGRDASPLIVSDFADGVVTGRVLVDGRPWTGRVGLVSVLDVFDLPRENDVVPATWLFRLGSTAPCDDAGRFELRDTVSGEHVLVLLFPGARPDPPRVTALPQVRLDRATRRLDVGTLAIDWSTEDSRERAAGSNDGVPPLAAEDQ